MARRSCRFISPFSCLDFSQVFLWLRWLDRSAVSSSCLERGGKEKAESLLFAAMDAADSRIVVDADAAMVVVMVAASS
jgi:hypothetical protein